MTQLTKEHFEQQLGKLATKDDLKKLVSKDELDEKLKRLATKEDLEKLITKEHFEQQLQQQTKELKAYTDEQTETLASITKRGFDSVDVQLKDIRKELDVRKDIEQLKLEMKDIRQALALDNTKQ